MKKKCLVCNKYFNTFSHVKKYCSIMCRSKFYQQQILKRDKDKICKRCKNKKIYPKVWYCNECNKIVLKEQYKKHKKLARKNSRIFYKKNKNNPLYKYNKNEKYKIYHKKRRREDLQFKIAVRLRNLLYKALTKYNKEGKAFSSKKYGIDFNKIINHLKPFPEGIDKWHIDHIIPLSSFNLKNSEEIKKAFAPENHQWLLASDNIRKGNKIRII